ncbi:efflux RND transporter permease subunit [Xylanibacter brevis]|uniref:efflux RND transporter permease subunit n=1 Tax=Xylanibacter brevis TaxID=83231 RepID=UPI00048501D5|nr:efflux RND transporter permease subunit [Xylanibacter brevis]
MLRKLIHRPIAVSMIVVAVMVVGIVALRHIPVSMMPQIDIPRITVQMSNPGASVTEIEQQLVGPMRQQLAQVAGLKDIESVSRMDIGTITLSFEPGADMDLLFIDVNEKVDRAMNGFDRQVSRPKIIKASVLDIPAFYVDITTANDKGDDSATSEQKLAQLSKLVRNVILKRFEQIPEVAMVDFSGTVGVEIQCVPDMDKLSAMGIGVEDIERTIRDNNITLGALSVVNGIYRYSVHFDAQILSKEDIENLYVRHGDRMARLKDICEVKEHAAVRNGIVKSNGKDAVTMAVIKQNDAQMEVLKEHVEELMEQLRTDYPDIELVVNRDQTELLSYSISNLEWNFALGALLACLILFVFNGGWRTPLLIIISIPLSLVLTLLCFYLFGITINIISLSGLILGVGMMVDNAIIVIDNIMQRKDAVRGTGEVFVPMLSSVLTTCSVFIPLIFLNGTTGALFYDQAMGVTMALAASLLVAAMVIPVYFHNLYLRKGLRGKKRVTPGERLLMRWYVPMNQWTMRHGKLCLSFFGIAVVLIAVLFPFVKKERMPYIEHSDALMVIDWNAGISGHENARRTDEVLQVARQSMTATTAMMGTQEFVLSHTEDITGSEAIVYFKTESKEALDSAQTAMSQYLAKHYPKAKVEYKVAGNVYDAIFQTDKPDLEIRLQNVDGGRPSVALAREMTVDLHRTFPDVGIQPVAVEENLQYVADLEQLAFYHVSYQQLYSRLHQLLGGNKVHEISIGTQMVPIVVGQDSRLADVVMQSTIANSENVEIPISFLVKERRVENYKRLHASIDGEYYPVSIEHADDKTVGRMMKHCDNICGDKNSKVAVGYKGNYFESRQMIGELAVVLLVSLLLLYFIMAAQFESLLQPFIIISEVVVDVSVVLLVLFACGESLNIMSMTGLVVMSGIVINDSILKVDTMNRLYRSGHTLLHAVVEAGHRRLKPIVMTSLTTILALVPFLHRGDMGSALQFPLSLTLTVGMVVGTLVSLFIVPLEYYVIYHLKDRKKK